MQYIIKYPKRLLNVILATIVSNLICTFLLGIQPASALSGSFSALALLNFLFYFGVIFFCVAAYLIFNILLKQARPNSPYADKKYVNIDCYGGLIFFLTLLGFFLLLYDRISLRGIDYMYGLRNARYMWLDSSGGNFAGLLGNILNSFGYLALFRATHAWAGWSFKNKLYFGLSILFSVIGLSFLNGGRANILFSMFILISIWVLSCRNLILYVKLRVALRLIIYGFIFIIPIVIVTESSAKLGGYTPAEQYIEDIAGLYGRIGGFIPDYGLLNDLIYRLNYMIVYLFHGQWTFQIAIDLPSQVPFYSLYPIKAFFAQFGIISSINTTGYFSDTGAFISLPGALFYDYGLPGILFGSMLLGVILGHAIFIYRKNIGAINYAYSVMVLLTVIMSPFCVPYGFSIFFVSLIPFFIVSFFSFVINKKISFHF